MFRLITVIFLSLVGLVRAGDTPTYPFTLGEWAFELSSAGTFNGGQVDAVLAAKNMKRNVAGEVRLDYRWYVLMHNQFEKGAKNATPYFEALVGFSAMEWSKGVNGDAVLKAMQEAPPTADFKQSFSFLVEVKKQSVDQAVPDSPRDLTVDGIRLWQKDGGMSQYGWIKEYSEDLNGDKDPEIFLAVAGFGRGADYAVFTKDQGSWKFIGCVSFGNLLIRVLPAKKESWHDFFAICPSGRGGVVETSYSWDGKTYVEKQSKEIPMEWKDGEYVPEDNSNGVRKGVGGNGDQAR